MEIQKWDTPNNPAMFNYESSLPGDIDKSNNALSIESDIAARIGLD
jgi:hypothetical protein